MGLGGTVRNWRGQPSMALALGAALALLGWANGARAQVAAPATATGIAGMWQGTLHLPQRDLRIVAKITDDGGAVKATMYSIDQSGQGIPASSASFAGGEFKFAVQMIDGSYDGKMGSDGKSITGTWTQGTNSMPLVLERTTPETEWTIPAPPPRIPPMPADAKPGIEVATIKPTEPGARGTYLIFRGADLQVANFSLEHLVMFAYGLQEKQIAGAPDWMSADKFDIDAKPDTPGVPNEQQLRMMVQRLLADRFALQVHSEQKEMAAYVLTVGKDGPKMTKDTDNPNGLPGLFFRQVGSPIILTVQNATMREFCGLMQSTVLDRPVVDRTGLEGRWNFLLKWTADETQFAGMRVPPPAANAADSGDAPPPLFTALPEQLGLKLEAQKTQVPVVVIDHVDHPSPN